MSLNLLILNYIDTLDPSDDHNQHRPNRSIKTFWRGPYYEKLFTIFDRYSQY